VHSPACPACLSGGRVLARQAGQDGLDEVQVTGDACGAEHVDLNPVEQTVVAGLGGPFQQVVPENLGVDAGGASVESGVGLDGVGCHLADGTVGVVEVLGRD
jgi:hypothetical protein